MFRARVIPCLLLKDKGLVKTEKFSDPVYLGDPINAVRIYNDFEADELIFLDIEASKNGKTVSLDFVKKVADEAFMPFGVGGGLRNLKDIREVFASGAEKAILNTAALENPELIKEAADIFGNQSIIVCIDARKQDGEYYVYSHSGTKKHDISPVDFAVKMQSLGAGEIIINSVDKDGCMEGYDLELIKLVSESVNVPVVALGGAGEIEDFKKALDSGASAVGAGSLFVFSGRNKGILINYPDKEELSEFLKDR